MKNKMNGPRSSRAESNLRMNSKQTKATETDYISLNRKMQALSKTMGKDGNMGASSFRNHAANAAL